MDKIRSLKGQVAYRCRDCRSRFYSAKPERLAGEHSEAKRHRSRRTDMRVIWKKQKRKIVNSAIFLVVLGLFVFCLNYLVNDHQASQTSLMSAPEIQKNA
jgi:hypothetical protein